MGKRKRGGFSGLSGLSGFVAKAFGPSSPPPPPESVDSENPLKAENTFQIRNDSEHTPQPGTTSTGLQDDAVNIPSKKRKLDQDQVGDESHETPQSDRHWVQKYDATGLVPHYHDISQVPTHLQKYFNQRSSYFSLYSTPPGCLLDEEGWYSVTPEVIATHIAERCRCDTIVDAFCGVGGNTIAFAKTCQRVIAIDNNPIRLALARHNARIYGVADHIEFILADYITFVKSYIASSQERPFSHNDTRKIDVVFLSPPWGGPSYLSGSSSPLKDSENGNGNGQEGMDKDGNDDEGDGDGDDEWSVKSKRTLEYAPYSLSSMKPIQGAELFHLSRKITKNIAFYLPRNTQMDEVSELVRESPAGAGGGNKGKQRRSKKGQDQEELIEVEEAWTGSKLKALTCYFGGLASGQENTF